MSALEATPQNVIQFPALTHDDVTQLTAPFNPDDHEFLRGFTYIREDAIATRLDSVDPSWQFTISEIQRRAGVSGDVITVMAHLTVKGVTRFNTGMAAVETTSDGKREANEAEKSATTDAFKRCARLFGIGRYILSMPKGVNERTIANALPPMPDVVVDGTSARKVEPAQQPEPEPQPTVMQVRLAGAEVRESKTGQPYIVLSTEKSDGSFGPRVTIWTRALLVEAGVIGKDDWGTVGETYVLNTRTTVEIEQDTATGYWELKRVIETNEPPPVDTKAAKKSLGKDKDKHGTPVGREPERKTEFRPSSDISVIATSIARVQHDDDKVYVRFYGDGDNDSTVLMVEFDKFSAMTRALANGEAYSNTVKLLQPGAQSKTFKALMLPDLEVLAIKVGDRYQVQKLYESNTDF